MNDDEKLNNFEDHINDAITKYKQQLEIMKKKKQSEITQSSIYRNASSSVNKTSSRSNEFKESEAKASNRMEQRPSKQLNIHFTENEPALSSTNYLSRSQNNQQNTNVDENRQTYSSLIMKDEKDRKSLYVELSNVRFELQNQEAISKALKEENERLKDIINQLSVNSQENYEVKLKNENLMKELSNTKNNEYDNKLKIEDFSKENERLKEQLAAARKNEGKLVSEINKLTNENFVKKSDFEEDLRNKDEEIIFLQKKIAQLNNEYNTKEIILDRTFDCLNRCCQFVKPDDFKDLQIYKDRPVQVTLFEKVLHFVESFVFTMGNDYMRLEEKFLSLTESHAKLADFAKKLENEKINNLLKTLEKLENENLYLKEEVFNITKKYKDLQETIKIHEHIENHQKEHTQSRKLLSRDKERQLESTNDRYKIEENYENSLHKAPFEITLKCDPGIDEETIPNRLNNFNTIGAKGRNHNVSSTFNNKLSTNLTTDSHKKGHSLSELPKNFVKDDLVNVSHNFIGSPKKGNNDNSSQKTDTNVYSPIHHNPNNKSRNSSMVSIANHLPNDDLYMYRTQYSNNMKVEGMKEFSTLKAKLKDLETKITAMNNDEKEKGVIDSLRQITTDRRNKFN